MIFVIVGIILISGAGYVGFLFGKVFVADKIGEVLIEMYPRDAEYWKKVLNRPKD